MDIAKRSPSGIELSATASGPACVAACDSPFASTLLQQMTPVQNFREAFASLSDARFPALKLQMSRRTSQGYLLPKCRSFRAIRKRAR
jgi:hypothetical protein